MESVWEYRWNLLDGVFVTVEVAIASVLISVVLGLLGAWGKLSGARIPGLLAEAYTTIIRGVPDLVLMLLIFFGGQLLLNDLGELTTLWTYIEVNPFMAGVLTIGFIFGAYMTETFRGAFLSIPKGQIEAAVACGMSPSLTFRRVIWPQLVRYALPSFTNNWLVLLKTTALVSVIGLQDVVYNANAGGKATQEPFMFFFAVLIIYLVLTAISDWGLNRLDRKYSAGVRRA